MNNYYWKMTCSQDDCSDKSKGFAQTLADCYADMVEHVLVFIRNNSSYDSFVVDENDRDHYELCFSQNKITCTIGLQDYTWKICRADILMDTTNGHDKSLVKEINELWNSGKRYKFQYILCALYERDIDEITGAMSFQDPRWVNSAEYKKGCETQQWCHYNEMALNDMTSHWEEYAENYLMHIADDMDLETVINFVR